MSARDNGLADGVTNAFALLRSHLEKIEGFDPHAFDRDIKQFLDTALSADGVTTDYAAGFRAPFDGLANKADIQSTLDLGRQGR